MYMSAYASITINVNIKCIILVIWYIMHLFCLFYVMNLKVSLFLKNNFSVSKDKTYTILT